MVFELLVGRLPLSVLKHCEPFLVNIPRTEWGQIRLFETGNLEGIKWLHKYNQLKFVSMDSAAKNGHLEVVKWLHESHFKGHLKTVKWFNGKSYISPFDTEFRSAYVEIRFLPENSEGCTTTAMDLAAFDGHLEVIKWLHENRTEGCTTDAMNWAAQNGHLEVVKFLHEHRTEGCTVHTII